METNSLTGEIILTHKPLAGVLQNAQLIEHRLTSDSSKNIKIAEECGTSLDNILAYLEKRGIVYSFNFIKESGKKEHRFILRILPDNDMVKVEIQDNGTGMDKATLKRVFEPFFTTKETGVGMGLGLSVSYFIITKNHYGAMSVESIPGQGTKFIIHLPIERRETSYYKID